MPDPLYCGAARRPITPDAKRLPGLRGLMDTRFGGVFDDLYVRALAIRCGAAQALVVGFDLDKAPYPAENMAELARRTGTPQGNILFYGIHTHSAPIIGKRPLEGPNDIDRKPPDVIEATRAYEREVVMPALFDVAEEAVRCLRPARMGHAWGESAINVNRVEQVYTRDADGGERLSVGIGTNPAGPVDRRLFALRFEEPSGAPIALLLNYAVHNVAMFRNLCGAGDTMAISGDIGGGVSRMLEERFPGSVALWSSGAAGDINPVMGCGNIPFANAQTGEMDEIIMGRDYAPAVLRALTCRHYLDALRAVEAIRCRTGAAGISAASVRASAPGRAPGVPYEVPMRLLRVGDIAMVGVGGELFTALGWAVQRASPLANTIIINHHASVGEPCNYVMDDATARLCAAAEGRVKLPGGRTGAAPGHIEAALRDATAALFEGGDGQ